MSNKIAYFLDSILAVMPITLFVVFGIIAGNTPVSYFAGVILAIVAPIFFVGVWAVWHYIICPKYNIQEKKSMFWKIMDQVMYTR